MDIATQQRAILFVMKAFHAFCQTHDLRYGLAYGSLLGAVRHKGFIPWDNDMDVVMPRTDYERLLSLARTEDIAEKVSLLHYSKDPKFHYGIIRIVDLRTKVSSPHVREYPERGGLWVDVFPMDTYPLDSSGRPRSFLRRGALFFFKVFQHCSLYAVRDGEVGGKRNSLRRLLYALYPDKNNRHARHVDRVAQSFPLPHHAEPHLLWDAVEWGALHMVCSAACFGELQLLDFEDTQFFGFAPDTNAALLEALYGPCWHELPPPEKRIAHPIDVQRVEVPPCRDADETF
jgi:lipopolysaccharide cholinephosphotransferase